MSQQVEEDENVLRIPISQISNWKWDQRKNKEKIDDQAFEELCENIKRNGQINAITVIREGKKYKVIAGRRRLAAFKKLGFKTIQAYVNNDLKEDLDIKFITASENTHRKNPTNTEEAYSWMDLYETAGYTKQQAIQGVKWMHNNKEETELISQDLAPTKNLYTGIRMDTSFRPDKKFIEITKRISKAPNTLYQYFQWIVQIQTEVLSYADKQELNPPKKILLTTTEIRTHPRIQREIIDDIKDVSNDAAQAHVEQVCLDLRNGVITQHEDGSYQRHAVGDDNREKVEDKDRVIKPPNSRVLEVQAACNKLLYHLTDIKKDKKLREYEEKHIEISKTYRLELVKGLLDNYLQGLEEKIQLTTHAIKDIAEIIEVENQDREMKREMLKQ